jgi:spermidine/putrescine transport system ATP-binding protein
MLEVREIYKDYESQALLKGVSFRVDEAETVCLLGPSGSGKSTLLRIIAGLEQPEHGQVLWDGEDLRDVPVHLRRFGLMFQDYALFPHRSVFENVAFGLNMQGIAAAEVRSRVDAALDQVHLRSFTGRRVTDLSGGEQQRVALARALTPQPRLLMLDEPLGALDRALREQLTEELRRLLHATRIPAVYVTHDQEEAFSIADRLLLLRDGRMVQSGRPEHVYAHPVDAWTAAFLGLTNLLEGEVVLLQPFQVKTAAGVFQPECGPLERYSPGDPLTVLLRPAGVRALDVLSEAQPEERNEVSGRVEDCVFREDGYRIRLRIPAGKLLQFTIGQPLGVGESFRFQIDPKMIDCLPMEEKDDRNHGS